MEQSIAGRDPEPILPDYIWQDIRILPTEELLLQAEVLGFVQLDSDDVSVAIAAATWSAIKEELAYRRRLVERHARNPVTPRWPETSSRTYQQLLDRARDLKTLWPIATFAERVMAVRLTRSGSRYVAQCPLPDHHDKTPSFTVFPDDDRWYCFGCCRGGDIIELAGLYFGVERFRDKVQRVEDATPGLTERTS